jgi:regulatory protein
MELEPEALKRLRASAGQMSAKMRAVRILSASSVSEKDLEQRLVRKGERTEDAREAVQWMQDMQLLDDRETARQTVSRCIRQGYGKARAKQALYEKRIPREYWEEALEDYPDQTEKITEFLHSRLGTQWDRRDLQRAMDALVRRGYSYPEIREGLKALEVDTEEFPEEY